MYLVIKKMVTLVLIVAMLMTSAGMNVFANSINSEHDNIASEIESEPDESEVDDAAHEVRGDDAHEVRGDDVGASYASAKEENDDVVAKLSEPVGASYASAEEESDDVGASDGVGADIIRPRMGELCEPEEDNVSATDDDAAHEVRGDEAHIVRDDDVGASYASAEEESDDVGADIIRPHMGELCEPEDNDASATDDDAAHTVRGDDVGAKLCEPEEIATASDADDDAAHTVRGDEAHIVHDDEVATTSNAEELNIENISLSELSLDLQIDDNESNALFGNLIDIPDANKIDFNGDWYTRFGLNGIPKENITKIEFTAGIKIPNTSSTQTWDIISIDASDASNKKYKILARGSVGSKRWWPSVPTKSYNGCEIDQFLSGTYYNGFPQYYKDNMILMSNMEERLYRGSESIPSGFLENIEKYIRIPMPLNDELDSVYLQNNPDKLANGKTWWTILHDNYAPGYTPLRGGSHYVKPDGDYDYPNRLPANYGSSCDIRPLMQMKEAGLKLDPNEYNFTWQSDITNTNGDLMGFAYIINDSGNRRVYVNLLYDDICKPVSDASNMFKDFVNVTEIKGLDIFDFSAVTNMSSMFEGCPKLTSIQGVKSNFGASVTNTSKMFKDCEKIKSVNFLPNDFGTNATQMDGMFENTELSSFPSKLKSNNATNMKRMFAKNRSTTFDFDSADLSACTDVSEMFAESATLSTITVNSNFLGLPSNVTTSTDMFKDSVSLVGGGGFSYKDQFVNGDFARVDFGGIMPGYFTCTDTSVYNNTEITITGDWRNNFAAEGVLTAATKILFTHEDLPAGSANDIDMPLIVNGTDVTGKAFLMDGDGSLIIQFVPQITILNTTDSWAGFFQGFENVTSIEGLDLIDTTPITSLEQTFNNCKNLATISIASFKTQNVITIESAFEDCEKLTHFVGDIPTFNSLVNAQYAFKNCSSLTNIKIDPFLSSGLLYVKELFRNCSALTNIYTNQRIVNSTLSIDIYNSENMFDGCTSLTGGQGTVYNNNYPKHIGMANTDFGGIKPGYFTLTNTSLYNNVIFTVPNTWYDIANYARSKTNVKEVVFLEGSPASATDFDVMFDMDGSYDKVKLYLKTDSDGKYIAKIYTGCNLIRQTKLPTNMSNFFSGFSSLTTISGWDKVDMTDIENMKGMFKDCSSLTSLDLTLFKTSDVTNMSEMFRGCTNLTTITVTTDFVTTQVTNSSNMFTGCTALQGDHGTRYSDKYSADPVTAVDKTHAWFDGRHGMDGYFTLSGTTTGYNASSISVNTKPETTYYIGDNFFPNGLILNVTWDDGVTTQIPYNATTAGKFTFDPDTTHALTPADTLETITYGGQTTTLTLTINPAIAYTFANNWFNGAGINKNTVKSISFIKFPAASPSSVISEWDIPDSNGLKGYVVADGTENEIVVYAPHVGTILGAQDCSNLFSDTSASNAFTNLISLNNLSNLVTSRMTDMSSMFSNCKKLVSLDLSSFNTLNVQDMSNMFDGCEELTSINTSSFNTKNVRDMSNMFYDCKKLVSVNTKFDTSSARDMACMFYNCNSLASLDVSSFNTSGVTDMQSMFYNCNNITALNLSGFNMGVVTNAEKMFYNCSKLASIGNVNLSSHDIRTCKSMFEGCSELTNINLSNFNTSNIGGDGFESMFSGCSKVKIITLGDNFVLGSATTLANMFNGCESLTSINLSSFSSNSINSVTAMFKNNRSLTTIVASNSFAVKNKTGDEMFLNCDVLEGGAGTKFSVAGVTNSSYAQVDEGTANPGYFTWGGDVVITFVGGDGAYGSMPQQTVKRNVATTLNANKFRKSGYTFMYWMDASGNIYTNTITAYDSITLIAQWQATYIPPEGGGRGGSSGGGGGGSSGGPMIASITPTTYLTTIKTISAVLDETQVKWDYNPRTDSFSLTATINGQVAKVANGFYIVNTTEYVNDQAVKVPNTYYFDVSGNMLKGWLVTIDGKKYFADTGKSMNEGELVIGWKLIDGAWYFFDIEGNMLVNTITPDGYVVGIDGKWSN